MSPQVDPWNPLRAISESCTPWKYASPRMSESTNLVNRSPPGVLKQKRSCELIVHISLFFDLQFASLGFVANSNQPLLKIVPDDSLVAEVFVTNRDIGFVKEDMQVDVRIDSFPFSEFGDVKGKLIWIGSDALPPDQIYPFYRFQAKFRLERQSLLVNKRVVPLQSGMSVSVNIKVRSRTVMSIFTDLFTKNVESLKFVR